MRSLTLLMIFLALPLSLWAQSYVGKDEQGRDCQITVLSRDEGKIKVKWEGINNGSTPTQELSNPLSATFTLKQKNEDFYQYHKYALPIGDFAIFETTFDFKEVVGNGFFTFHKINALTGRSDFLRCEF